MARLLNLCTNCFTLFTLVIKESPYLQPPAAFQGVRYQELLLAMLHYISTPASSYYAIESHDSACDCHGCVILAQETAARGVCRWSGARQHYGLTTRPAAHVGGCDVVYHEDKNQSLSLEENQTSVAEQARTYILYDNIIIAIFVRLIMNDSVLYQIDS